MFVSAVLSVSRVYWEVVQCIANEISPIQAACDSVVHPLWGSIKPSVGYCASAAEVLDSLPFSDSSMYVSVAWSQCTVA